MDKAQFSYCIGSFEPNAQTLATAVRHHWGIENGLHWVLDVAFREDDSRVRKDHAPYVERLIGSIRRECLDHVIVLNERHLKRILTDYFDYYHRWRTHRSLAMDCPQPRAILPPELGSVVEIPEVGGLHHHYERMAA